MTNVRSVFAAALRGLSAFALLGALGCSSSSESARSQEAALGAGPVTCGASLSATLSFQGPQGADGTVSFAPPLSFAIPSSLPITAGSSKNGHASLAFTTPGGATVTCDYTLKNAATSFAFTRCSNSDAAGARESAVSVVLHIQNADHGADATGTEISIGLPLSAPDGSGCTGTNACFATYTCQGGQCTGSRGVSCTALDQCHVAGTCDSATGICSNPAAANGTSCDDGNRCHLNDACQFGVCTPASSVVCTALDPCHIAGSCDPSSGVCSNPTASDGTACDDGNPCDRNDTCQAGACAAGSPVQCTALDQCHVPGVCDVNTGQCSNPAVADGTVCTDGNACHLLDTCQVGACTAGISFTCPAGQSCSPVPQICIPKTCADLVLNCGPAGDGCGGQLDCGSACPVGQVCGGGGSPGVCGPVPVCAGLCQQQVACPGGGTTSVTGHVFAPNGLDPIFNALVYVPNSPLAPFTPNVSCQQCGDEVSGSPLVSTHSGADGRFTLSNVPVGVNIPLVIQIGRWRRQVTLPTVASCVNNLAPASLTRLPSNRSQGDIPQIALVTGQVDALECVLRKIGISDSEFTSDSGLGRVHLYFGNGATIPGTQSEAALTASQAAIDRYDMTILSCEGTEMLKTAAQQHVLINYASAGGRVFATHYNYTWLFNDAPFSSTASWHVAQPAPPSPLPALVDLTNPRGGSLADWLLAVGASTTRGQISLTAARHDFDAVTPATSTRWLYWNQGSVQVPLHYTFDTPVGVPAANQCGRVLYSDFHIDGDGTTFTGDFPSECVSGAMTPQEHMLEFMLFDLSSCVSEAPPPSCTPRTCAQQGVSCGPAGDGCGHLLDCGSCVSPQTCGGGGAPGACGNPLCSQ